MWGDSQVVEIVSVAAGLQRAATAQIARVNYARPETWRFLFAAKIIDRSATIDAGAQLIVNWNMQIGVGRSRVEMLPFAQFIWSPIGGIGSQKFASRVRTPLVNDDLVNTDLNYIDQFVSQDIQLSATLIFVDVTPDERVRVELYGSFAPNTHVRPEWYARIGVFSGQEASGR